MEKGKRGVSILPAVIALLALAILLIIITAARGSPFLVCDVQPTATYYMVSIDGGGYVKTPAPLHYDLGWLSDGSHTARAQACNSAGCSADATLSFTKKPPVDPGGIHLGR